MPQTMFAPDGSVRIIPDDQVEAAKSAGGIRAIKMQDPQGVLRWIPEDKYQDALSAGGKLADPSVQTQFEKERDPANQPGFWKSAGAELLNQGKGAVETAGMALPYLALGQSGAGVLGGQLGEETVQRLSAADDLRARMGRSKIYRAAAIPASLIANVEGMEQAADIGNAKGVAGVAFGDAAPMAAAEGLRLGVPPAVRSVVDAFPSTQRAGEAFQRVMQAAKNRPVDVSTPGDVALRMQNSASLGGQLPKVVRDFLKRVTDPDKGPLTYQEAREFESNAARLSRNERGRLSAKAMKDLGDFRSALRDSVSDTADQAGKLGDYQRGMNEYAQAMELDQKRRILKSWLIKNGLDALRGSVLGTGAAAGYKLYNDLTD